MLSRLPSTARPVLALAAAIAAYGIAARVSPNGAPLGIVALGVVFGALNALVALGIVLVYRANKVVNFAQAEFGSVAAVLAIEFRIQLGWNYFLAVAAGLAISLVLGALVEMVIIRRFYRAPRLILAVVTIGLAQVLSGIAILIPIEWNGLSNKRFTTPFTWRFSIKPVVMNANYLVAVIAVVAVLIALTAFLRYSAYGVAIRAAAENGDRANLLGVPVKRLSTIVWALSGFMSALAVILRVPILGFSSFSSVSGGGFSLLLRTLAAAVIGGMESLPVTAAAAIGLGILQELGAWWFHNATYVDAMLLGIILIALLAQRDKLTRAADTGIGTWGAMQEVRPIPPELRKLPEVRYGLATMRALLIAIAIVLPLFLSPARQQLLGLIVI
ncbi:MAG: branched-chain amino acid transport system permease protein livM, partial [Actinomycetota bacterium]|nr:branched-chain amino acid transport system permease protein livM [Actinomycetota bacterium]